MKGSLTTHAQWSLRTGFKNKIIFYFKNVVWFHPGGETGADQKNDRVHIPAEVNQHDALKRTN